MEDKRYKIGDNVWYANGGNKLVPGTVVYVFQLDGYSYEHYVVSTPTHIEEVFEVRDWNTLSSDAKGPLNIWKMIGKHRG